MDIRRIVNKIKKPFIIVGGLLIIYVVSGVFILPALLKSKIPEIIQQETGRKALISKIQVQPFPLSVSLQGFEMQEHNGQPFAVFDVFYIKMGLLQSIMQLAPVIDKVILKKPFIHIARQKNGTFNFQDLFKAKADDKKGKPQLFPVTINKLLLLDGQLIWEDASSNELVKEDVSPINLDIENFTTQADKQAHLSLSLALKSGGQLDWKGTVGIKPLSSEGYVKFDNVKLETISALVLPDTTPFNLKGYELLDGNYKANYTDDSLKFIIDKGKVEIRDFQFLEKGHDNTLIKMPVFALRGIDFNFEEQAIAIESLSADDAVLQAWLNAQGVINYQILFPAPKTGNNIANKTVANPVKSNEAPWKIKVNSIALNNFGVVFEDQSQKKPVVMDLKPINFKLTDYSSEPGASVPFQLSAVLNKTGLIKLAGDTVIQPFSAKTAIDVKDIVLENFQAYLNKFARLDVIGGKLTMGGDAIVAASKNDEPDVKFKGNTAIADLLIRDQLLKAKGQNKVLAKVPVFAVRGIDFNLGNRELVLDSISANNADLQAWLNPEGVINYQALLPISNAEEISANKTVANNTEHQAATWKIKINNMALTNFGLNFEDQTLKDPVAVTLKPINFKLSNYSNKNGETLPVQLSIGMNKTGLITLKGNAVIDPLSASFTLMSKISTWKIFNLISKNLYVWMS